MTMAVMNRAMETSTEFGGLCCSPSAVRNRDSTTIMRTNDVVIITIDGASESTVKRPTSCTTRSVSPPPEPRSRLIAWAAANVGTARLSTVASSDNRAARPNSPQEALA